MEYQVGLIQSSTAALQAVGLSAADISGGKLFHSLMADRKKLVYWGVCSWLVGKKFILHWPQRRSCSLLLTSMSTTNTGLPVTLHWFSEMHPSMKSSPLHTGPWKNMCTHKWSSPIWYCIPVLVLYEPEEKYYIKQPSMTTTCMVYF